MKKSLFFSIVCLLSVFNVHVLAQTNLLPNGDFEAWTSGKPDKWAGPANNATLSQSTDAHGGSYAVKVGATANSNKRLASNSLNLLAGTYKVSFWAKGGQVRPGYVIVTNGAIASSGDYKYGDFATLSATEWTKVDYEFTLTATTTVNIVVMNPKTTQNKYDATEAIIDDMTLTTQDGGLGEFEHDAVYYNGIYYRIEENNACVIYSPNGYSGDIILPASIVYNSISYPVIGIDGSAFRDCSNLTSISIPSSVISIGDGAFSGCTSLTSVTLNSDAIVSKNNTSSSHLSFIFGSQVTEYILGDNVTGIGSYAFYRCKGLTSVTIPNSVTSIGDYAFYGCAGLASVTISESVTSIGESAFKGCSGLQSITIPNSVTSIGYGAFSFCTSLTSVTLNSDAIVSKNYTSSSHLSSIFGSQVTEYILGDNVKDIGSYAFYYCKGLTSVTIPNSVTSIGDYAFYFCDGLASITLPNSVTSIGSNAFKGCTSLTSVTLNSDAIVSKNYTSSSNLSSIFGSQVTEYILGDNVTGIGSYAFYGCKGLTSVTIPNSVTSIGDYAFSGCAGLASVTISESVTSIGSNAFSGCTSLTSVTLNSDAIVSKNYTSSSNLSSIFGSQVTEYILGDNVTGIGSYAFYGCKGLTSVTIPNSVTSIGDYAFSGCAGLASVTISESVTSIGSNAFKGCSGLQSITIPNSVTSIGDGAFSGCTSLTSVTLNSDAIVSKNYTSSSNLSSIFGSQVKEYILGDNVTGIGSYAFYYCKGLTSVTIPNSVTSIGNMAFFGCTSLTNITIPNSVTSIGDYAFYGCANLTGATLSESLNYIGKEAFTGCNSVKLYVQRGGHVALWVWENGHNCYDVATSELILKPKLTVVSTTQCTATLSIENNSESYVFKVGDNVVANVGSITLNDLKPQTAGEVNLYASCKDEEKWYDMGRCQYTTANISPTATTKATGSSIMLTPSYIQGDATVTEQKMTFNGVTQDVEAGKEYRFTSLSPNRNYSVTYTLTANGYDFTYNGYVRCEQLVLNSQQPKVINTGNVIVAAKTNLDEAETNVGFEWRRTDWTDDFNSKSGGAYLYEGTIEGYIRDLNTEKLWKYRPFYESADGTRHYGEWVGIDPTDTSYFDPTVDTYASIDVQGNTASVRGYVMRGTDNVTEQGFKYWKASGNVRNYDGEVLKAVTIPIDAQTITASGQVMTASLSGLDYETDYYCVAFVTTSEGTVFYGEQQAFRTGEAPTGIEDVAGIEDSKARTIEGYYNLQGQRMAEPQRGVNIIRYSDGTAKKVLLK